PFLAAGDGAKFSNAVARRMAPPEPKPRRRAAPPTPAPDAPRADPEEDAPRSPLQKLVEKFR
ncbi:MAG: aminoacyl-tRNA hydrolase, partial [Alphaproteobacteria bacterium]